jgi:hypothetical protein
MPTVSVYFPDEQARAVRTLAVARDTSVSAVVRDPVLMCLATQLAEIASLLRRGHDSERLWRLFLTLFLLIRQ